MSLKCELLGREQLTPAGPGVGGKAGRLPRGRGTGPLPLFSALEEAGCADRAPPTSPPGDGIQGKLKSEDGAARAGEDTVKAARTWCPHFYLSFGGTKII